MVITPKYWRISPDSWLGSFDIYSKISTDFKFCWPIRGQRSTRSSIRGSVRDGARRYPLWRRLPAEYGKGKSVYRRASPVGATEASGLAGRRLQAGRPGSVHRAAGQHGQARTRERGGRAREVDPTLGRNQGRLPHPDPYPSGSTGPSPAPARAGRPASRPHPSPGLGSRLDGRAAVLPDHESSL